MADTTAQREAADWIRTEWMPSQFGVPFEHKRTRLEPGGEYRFDAISEDCSLVAAISTSAARTASGHSAVGKFVKLRSDILFLLMAPAKRRLVILTEKDMYDRCIAEKDNGRLPKQIEFVHVQLPPTLLAKLKTSRETASDEVSPR